MANDAMLRYEALILAVPEVTVDQASALESQLHDFISKQKGETVLFDRWGKFRLAYSVKKHEYGVYYLSRFDLPEENVRKALEELRQFFAVKNNELIMRHMVTALEKDAPAEYKRPESLEETPRREFDSFRRGGRPGAGAPRREDRRFESTGLSDSGSNDSDDDDE
jgi:ribosomal protein S6